MSKKIIRDITINLTKETPSLVSAVRKALGLEANDTSKDKIALGIANAFEIAYNKDSKKGLNTLAMKIGTYRANDVQLTSVQMLELKKFERNEGVLQLSGLSTKNRDKAIWDLSSAATTNDLSHWNKA